MIVILASWIFILVNCYLFGFALNKFLFKQKTISVTIVLGVIFISIIANIASFFLPLNNTFLFIISFISCLYLVIYFKKIKQQLLQLKKEIFSFKNIVLLIASAVLFAAYSSGYSNINDDGLYYTQTIMWLREYGLVHGISNLHLSLGLSSSWHVFQAVFTFSNTLNLNDVNGFLMFVFTLFIIEKNSNKNINYLLYFQYFLVLIISIPFYSAPNPDFAIIVFTAIAIQLFLTTKNRDNYPLILLIASYCFTVKISSILVSFLAFFVLYKLLKNASFKLQSKLYILLFLMLTIQVSKNIYQTSYPLYPYKILSVNTDWKTPEAVVSYFTNGVKTWSYSNKFRPNDVNEIKDIGALQLLESLLFRSGTKGLINKVIFASFLLSILLVSYLWFKNKINQQTIILQAVTGISLIIWFVFAPQYRFAMPMLVYYLAFIFYLIYYHFLQKFIKINLYFVHVSIIILLFIPTIFGLNINGNETSKQIGQFEQIKPTQLLYPMPKYTFAKMDTIVVNNTPFYHVNGNTYCWNSPLPCMSKGYEKIIFDNFKCRISLRGKSLGEGFKFISYQ
ncbi:MAG: LIC_10190 family membrane protein [Bacteroidia bacterium]